MTSTSHNQPRIWSPQQVAFFNWCETGQGSAILEAVAGAGKSTSLVEACKRFPKGTSIAILAFNKKIAVEMTDKIAGMNNVRASTVHAIGLAAFQSTFGRPKIEGYKVQNIVETMLRNAANDGNMAYADKVRPYTTVITKLVGFAKQRALGVLGSIEDKKEWHDIASHFDVFSDAEDVEPKNALTDDEVINIAIRVLAINNGITDVIDFDDMVYMPVLLKAKFHRYDVVMIDEAQDTNPARRALVRCILNKGGRVIAVGDKHQAIYGFTGADSDSLDLIAKDFSAIYLPLTITYRCPKAVVEFSRQWVSHISAAETAPQGSVSTMTMENFLKLRDLNSQSAVLSRLNAPLVALAFKLIRNKIACKVEGRDIGMGLKKLANRWKIKTTDLLIERLDEYQNRETTKALAKKNETKAQTIEDTVETLKVIIESVNAEGKHNVTDVLETITNMFGDDVKGVLRLSSVHKAKGLEWNTVYWLNRAKTCPSKYARQAWQKEQENNLCYVAATRSKDKLIDLID